MRRNLWIVAVAGVLSLSACGDTALQQGLFGAGAGAATAVVLGGDAASAAAIGAGANVLFCQSNPGQCN